MGRGRAKAIQKRIARDLKYTTTGTDLERLRAELASDKGESDEYANYGDLDEDGEIDDDVEGDRTAS